MKGGEIEGPSAQNVTSRDTFLLLEASLERTDSCKYSNRSYLCPMTVTQ